MPNLRMAVIDHLKYQLPRLAEGHYTVQRLADVAKDRLETAWDALTPQEIEDLGRWLESRVQASEGEARLRWGFVRGVFETVRDERGGG